MVSRTILYGMLAGIALTSPGTEGSEYGMTGGIYPSGLPFFAYGYSGSLYGTGRVPVPPYFAIHPPVYYSTITPRTYGDSPFAWSGRPRQAEVGNRRLIINQFYTPPVEVLGTSTPVAPEQHGETSGVSPANLPAPAGDSSPEPANRGSAQAIPALGGASNTEATASPSLSDIPQPAPGDAASSSPTPAAGATAQATARPKRTPAEKAVKKKKKADRAARKAAARSNSEPAAEPASAQPAPAEPASSSAAEPAAEPTKQTTDPTAEAAAEAAQPAAKTPDKTEPADAKSDTEQAPEKEAAATTTDARASSTINQPPMPHVAGTQPGKALSATSALAPANLTPNQFIAASKITPAVEQTQASEAVTASAETANADLIQPSDVRTFVVTSSSHGSSSVMKFTVSSSQKPIRNPFFEQGDSTMRSALNPVRGNRDASGATMTRETR